VDGAHDSFVLVILGVSVDLFDNGVKERSEGISSIREVRSSVDTDWSVHYLAASKDTLLESAAPVVLLVLQLVPDLPREMLSQERGAVLREFRHAGKFIGVEQVVNNISVV